MAQQQLVLTDAHRRQMEDAMKRLSALKREMEALQKAGVMDCSDYLELCEFVNKSLQTKHTHFFPNGRLKKAAKGGDE